MFWFSFPTFFPDLWSLKSKTLNFVMMVSFKIFSLVLLQDSVKMLEFNSQNARWETRGVIKEMEMDS